MNRLTFLIIFAFIFVPASSFTNPVIAADFLDKINILNARAVEAMHIDEDIERAETLWKMAFRALKAKPQDNPEIRLATSNISRNLASVYIRQEKYEKAEEYLKTAKELCDPCNDLSTIENIKAHIMIQGHFFEIYYETGRKELAAEIQKELRKYYEMVDGDWKMDFYWTLKSFKRFTFYDIDKRKVKILLVGNDPESGKKTTELLDQAGYSNPLTAGDVQAAFDTLAKSPCDIVLCNMKLSTDNGMELLNRVRSDPDLKHLPFIMILDSDKQIETLKGVDTINYDYIVRPLTLDELDWSLVDNLQ